jgi:hypothetical protein
MNIEISRGLDRFLFGMTEQDLAAVERNRLGWLSVYDPVTTMGDFYLWKMPKDELLARLSATLGEPFAMNDYGEMESYYFPKHEVELQYQLGRLDAFNFGVPYGDDDQPIWPPLHH